MIKNTLNSLKEDKIYLVILAVFTFLFLFFTSKTSILYPTNDWSDVNVYFNIGKAMMNGRILYTESFDHKGPLIFIIYGIGYLVSNTTFLGVFLLLSVGWILVVACVFKTAKLFLNSQYAFLVALLTPLLVLNYTHSGGSAEEFIFLFASVSLFFFYAYYKQREYTSHAPSIMFVHGILVAMVFFIKLNLVLFWVFPILGIFSCILLCKNYKNLLYNALAFMAGILLIAAPIGVYLLVNNALDEAFHVYILFNKKYGGLMELGYTIEITCKRFYTFVKFDFIGSALALVGAFYIPIKYIENKVGRIVLPLAGLSMFFIIFTPRTFHFYYPLSLCVFIIPGLIWAGMQACKYIQIGTVRRIFVAMAVVVLLIAINKKQFYGIGADGLLRLSTIKGPNYQFAEIIKKEENPTLLNLGFALSNNIFTLTNIVPQHQYFFTPNIYYGMYPAIRDSQTRYITNKEIDFIVIDSASFNYDYFKDLPILFQNYEIIDTCAIDGGIVYYLFKRKG